MAIDYMLISLFLFLGVCFGLATFHHRHLFSEGPTKSEPSDAKSILDGRIFWILVCALLWPILVLTGVNTAWILAKRRKQLEK